MAAAEPTSPSGLMVNRITTVAMNGVERFLRQARGMTYRVERKKDVSVMNVSK